MHSTRASGQRHSCTKKPAAPLHVSSTHLTRLLQLLHHPVSRELLHAQHPPQALALHERTALPRHEAQPQHPLRHGPADQGPHSLRAAQQGPVNGRRQAPVLCGYAGLGEQTRLDLAGQVAEEVLQARPAVAEVRPAALLSGGIRYARQGARQGTCSGCTACGCSDSTGGPGHLS